MFQKDDQQGQVVRAILMAQQAKAHNFFFCECCIESIVQSCCVLVGKGLIVPAMLMMMMQFVTVLALMGTVATENPKCDPTSHRVLWTSRRLVIILFFLHNPTRSHP